ncbi:pantoate--beta-alanine ligase [Endothiovibrio diazotrophicus]
MKTVHTVDELREQVGAWRREGARVALVPTMGNLHAGHIALVTRARELADRVVASIFVNPTQFGEGEDFEAYPRTLATDRTKLTEAGLDLLFAPSESEVYPDGRAALATVSVPGISEILCGASRPGHFTGVATVVAKLFNMVLPDVALFGEKDFQQLMVLRRMARDLDFPVEIVGHPIVREADGLAMSSRNGYLSAGERVIAPELQRTLRAAAERLLAGEETYAAIATEAERRLVVAGFRPDYFEVRRAADLGRPAADERELVILAAAHLGRARLIDNVVVRRP